MTVREGFSKEGDQSSVQTAGQSDWNQIPYQIKGMGLTVPTVSGKYLSHWVLGCIEWRQWESKLVSVFGAAQTDMHPSKFLLKTTSWRWLESFFKNQISCDCSHCKRVIRFQSGWAKKSLILAVWTRLKLHGKFRLGSGSLTCILPFRPPPPAAWTLHTSSCWSDLAGRMTRSGRVCSSLAIGRFQAAFALTGDRKENLDKVNHWKNDQKNKNKVRRGRWRDRYHLGSAGGTCGRRAAWSRSP